MTIMEATKLKIGDIVICNTSFERLPQKGWKGKVIQLKPYIGVEWDNCFYYGHNCRDKGRDGFCREYIISDYINNENVSIIDLAEKNKQLNFEF